MFKSINGGKLPSRGSKYSACVDLYTNEDVVIFAGENKTIKLGVALDYDKFPLYVKNNLKSFYLELNPRSSTLKNYGLIGMTGIIDIDYTGEIMLNVFNSGAKITIKKDTRIAQITLLEHKSYLFDIHSKDERIGGFGSTDKWKSTKYKTEIKYI